MDSKAMLFIKHLNDKDCTVSKDDLLNLALECGLDLNPKIAMSKIIEAIIEKGYFNRLFDYFVEFILIPSWEVADFYNISSAKLNQLKTIGAIKEQPTSKKFYSRRDKGYFDADVYPLSVLNYDKQELLDAYENAFGGDVYSLRIETKDKLQIEPITNELQKTFKMERVPDIYEHRNEDGFYTYYKVKLLNNSNEESNRFLSEINKLKKEKEDLKKKNDEQIERIFKILREYLGDDVGDVFSLTVKLQKLTQQQVRGGQ